MRIDLIRLWLTVALAGVLAIATVAVYRTPASVTTSVCRRTDGALLFQAKGCSGCHTIAGVAEFASIGPNLTHLSEVADERVAGMERGGIRDPIDSRAAGLHGRRLWR